MLPRLSRLGALRLTNRISQKSWNETLAGAPGVCRGASLRMRHLSDDCRPGSDAAVSTCLPFYPTQLLSRVSRYCVRGRPIERHPCLWLAHTTIGLK